MKTFKTPGGLELPLLDLRGKDYLQVSHRLVWFRAEKPEWSIETEYAGVNDQAAFAKATIRDEKGRIIATAHKYEDKQGFSDYREKAETGSVGRALALIGYGTQFAHELEEGERIVDSPIQKPQLVQPTTQNTFNTPAPSGTNIQSSQGVMTVQQAGEIKVPFGKNAGMAVKQLRIDQILNDLGYWESRLKQEGKSATGQLKTYIEALSVYEKSMNQAPVQEEPPFMTEGDPFL